MAKKVQYTTNQPSASTDYLAADNTWKPMSGGGSGTVTSVAVSVPTALSVSGSPITTNGTITIVKDKVNPIILCLKPSSKR